MRVLVFICLLLSLFLRVRFGGTAEEYGDARLERCRAFMPVPGVMQTVERAEFWGAIIAMQAYWPCHLGIDNLNVAGSIGRLLDHDVQFRADWIMSYSMEFSKNDGGSYFDSGGSRSLVTPRWLSENIFPCFQGSTWHTALDASDHVGSTSAGMGSYCGSGGFRGEMELREHFSLVFWAPRGTLLVMRPSPMVQLPPAPSVLALHFRADWTLYNFLTVSSDSRACSGDGFS